MSNYLTKAAFWVTVSEIIYNMSGFVIHSVVGRILGPADYGRYGLVITLTTMVIILIGNGIPTAMAKYLSEIFERQPALVPVIKKQAILLQSIVIGVIASLFFIASPLIAHMLGDPTLKRLFQISSLVIPAFAAASFYFSYYTGLHKFGIQSFLKVSRSVFRLVFIIALAYFFHIEGSIVGYIVAPGAVFLVAMMIDKFKVSKELRPVVAKNLLPLQNDTKPFFDWHKLVNYAWQIVLFFLAYELLISIDLYLVKGILRDDFQTGIYNAALTIGRIPYYIFYALTVILLPVISKTTSENNREETSRIISQSLRLMLILLVPFVILMSVFSEPIIKLFYGARYIDAAFPMSILVFGVGLLTIFYVFCFVMSGADKVKKPMILSIIGLALNIVLNYILIKSYGIAGSAIATGITSAIITFVMLYYVWKDFGVKISLGSFSKMALAGILMYAISRFFSQGNLLFIPWSAFLFVFYLFMLYLFREIKKEDFGIFLKMIRKKKNPVIPA